MKAAALHQRRLERSRDDLSAMLSKTYDETVSEGVPEWAQALLDAMLPDVSDGDPGAGGLNRGGHTLSGSGIRDRASLSIGPVSDAEPLASHGLAHRQELPSPAKHSTHWNRGGSNV